MNILGPFVRAVFFCTAHFFIQIILFDRVRQRQRYKTTFQSPNGTTRHSIASFEPIVARVLHCSTNQNAQTLTSRSRVHTNFEIFIMFTQNLLKKRGIFLSPFFSIRSSQSVHAVQYHRINPSFYLRFQRLPRNQLAVAQAL